MFGVIPLYREVYQAVMTLFFSLIIFAVKPLVKWRLTKSYLPYMTSSLTFCQDFLSSTTREKNLATVMRFSGTRNTPHDTATVCSCCPLVELNKIISPLSCPCFPTATVNRGHPVHLLRLLPLCRDNHITQLHSYPPWFVSMCIYNSNRWFLLAVKSTSFKNYSFGCMDLNHSRHINWICF